MSSLSVASHPSFTFKFSADIENPAQGITVVVESLLFLTYFFYSFSSSKMANSFCFESVAMVAFFSDFRK